MLERMQWKRFSPYTLMALLGAGVTFYCLWNFSKLTGYGELQVCNTAPYPMEATVVVPKKTEFKKLAEFYFKPGDCANVEHRFWGDDPQFLISADIRSSDRPLVDRISSFVDQQLLADGTEENNHLVTGIKSEDFRFIGSLPLCFNERIVSVAHSDICASGEEISYFLPAFQMMDGGERYKPEWYFFWQHPNLNLSPPDRSFVDGLIFAKSNALRLSGSLETEYRYKDLGKITWAFSVGGQLDDFNGPLELGVLLSNVPSLDIYGNPMSIENGDVIVSFNGVSIYSTLDLMHQLYNHGINRSKGIGVPITYQVQRGVDILTISSPYFFNKDYRKYSGDMSGVAFWYGVGDAISFGQTPWSTCGLAKGLDIVATGASSLAERLKSWSEDRPYNRDNVRSMTIDAEECVWQKTQSRALARQTEDEIYVNSQWFGIVTPSGLRLVASKALAKETAKIVGRNAISRGLAGAILETGETTLWALGTAPPGTPLSDRLKDGIRFAPLAATAGFVSDAAIAHKGR